MRRVKGFFVLLLVLGLLAGAGVIVLRVGRSKVSEPTMVRPNLVAVSNAGGVYVYGFKVGPRVIFFDAGLDPEGHPLDAALAALQAGRA